jgi:subtilisin family serine protease
MTHRHHCRGIAATVVVAASLCAAFPTVAQGEGQPGAAQANADGKVRVTLAFKPGASGAARAAIAKAGGRILVDLSAVSALAIEVPAVALPGLRRNPNVEFVEDDPERHAFRPPGAQPSRVGPAGASSRSEVAPYGIAMVQADKVADSLAGGRKLCIIDSGIDRAHEDLAGVTLDGVNLTGSGEWFTDENSHGTHVAGTVAAVDNTVGVVGVMPRRTISLYIAKVFDASGSARSSVITKAMLACRDAGAHVVSMSLGSAAGSKTEERAADQLAKSNVLVIAAAGNDGNAGVSYPAGFASVVSVAAIDENKSVASFSQFNADVELSAPGVDVLSTVPAGSQMGASLSVGASTYAVQPVEGSPLVRASGPLADFGLGTTASAGSMSGKVCLISRGTNTFAEKVLNCQSSGGVGAVIYNNAAGALSATLGSTVTAIPSVGALQADGATMLGQAGQPTTVAVFVSPNAYAYYSGTSMATPHVSAVAALVWSYFPQCTASQMRSSLQKSAQDLGTSGRDVYYGFGLVQAKAAHDRISTKGCGN